MAESGAPDDGFPPDLPTDRPTTARVYGLYLGSKDNFAIDREAAAATLEIFPEFVDIARQNRRFLYRAVRYLSREAGIRQFLDLGSGLPTEDNVHQVVGAFRPDARVVYVDNDPIVLAHGRALLADDSSTTVIQADLTEPPAVLESPEAGELLDLREPVAVLLLGMPHCIGDDARARRAVRGYLGETAPGSHLAVSQVVSDDPEVCAESTRLINELGAEWKTRTSAEAAAMLDGLEPVDPGLCDVDDWRPDPDQPELPEPHPVVRGYLGASGRGRKRAYVYGGVLRAHG